ncbi:hypothetical protein [Streptomyces sp. CS149]|nr:hypothetical protein [Streptomyces sp. CS149]
MRTSYSPTGSGRALRQLLIELHATGEALLTMEPSMGVRRLMGN